MDELMRGFVLSIEPLNVFLMVIGTLVGIIIGALPGLGPTAGIALLIPITFGMEASSALLLAAGIYMGATYGGSITAVLLGIPGTPTNAATCFDGYAMSRQGHSMEAMGASLLASMVGGVLSVLCLMFFTPIVSRFVLYFGASEQFMLAIFGLSVIAVSSKDSFLKGILGGFFGLAISTVGYDAITGFNRFNFEIIYLDDGIQFMAIVVGLFGFSQALALAEEATTISGDTKLRGSILSGGLAVFKYWYLTLKSSLLGMFLGIAPGVGGTAASMLAYSFAQRNDPERDTFGKGNIRGVIAPEASNNATIGTAIIPTLAFGIPGSPTCAVMMGLLMVHNIVPGPRLFQEIPDTLYTFFWGLLYSCFAMVIIAWPLIRFFAKVTVVPYQVLVPSIIMLCILGSFSIRGYIFDSFITVIFGFLGYYLRKAKYPMVCIILGLVLGSMTESNFSRSLMIYGDLSFLYTRPITLALIILTAVIVILPYFDVKKIKGWFAK